MKKEHSTKCDKCESVGESDTHSRVFFKKINGKWLWLCKTCWDLQLSEIKKV